jgi:8-oxo-dGTP diphosphatase
MAYQRDDRPEIRFQVCGIFRAADARTTKTPMECAIHETFEEFHLVTEPTAIVWERYYPASSEDFGRIVFGDDGQQ